MGFIPNLEGWVKEEAFHSFFLETWRLCVTFFWSPLFREIGSPLKKLSPPELGPFPQVGGRRHLRWGGTLQTVLGPFKQGSF